MRSNTEKSILGDPGQTVGARERLNGRKKISSRFFFPPVQSFPCPNYLPLGLRGWEKSFHFRGKRCSKPSIIKRVVCFGLCAPDNSLHLCNSQGLQLSTRSRQEMRETFNIPVLSDVAVYKRGLMPWPPLGASATTFSKQVDKLPKQQMNEQPKQSPLPGH